MNTTWLVVLGSLLLVGIFSLFILADRQISREDIAFIMHSSPDGWETPSGERLFGLIEYHPDTAEAFTLIVPNTSIAALISPGSIFADGSGAAVVEYEEEGIQLSQFDFATQTSYEILHRTAPDDIFFDAVWADDRSAVAFSVLPSDAPEPELFVYNRKTRTNTSIPNAFPVLFSPYGETLLFFSAGTLSMFTESIGTFDVLALGGPVQLIIGAPNGNYFAIVDTENTATIYRMAWDTRSFSDVATITDVELVYFSQDEFISVNETTEKAVRYAIEDSGARMVKDISTQFPFSATVLSWRSVKSI